MVFMNIMTSFSFTDLEKGINLYFNENIYFK